MKIIPQNYSSIVTVARLAAMPMETFTEVRVLILCVLIKNSIATASMIMLPLAFNNNNLILSLKFDYSL
jgi:hypothetical protein